MVPNRVYLSLGSNLGDRQANLHNAIDALQRESIRLLAQSSIYETEPRDVLDQPWFLNMVIACETKLLPLPLLAALLRIERELGRTREEEVRRGPRTIDLDILLYGETILKTDALTVPHPRLVERRFVLEPLLEIVPDLSDPESKKRFSVYLRGLEGQVVRRLVGQLRTPLSHA